MTYTSNPRSDQTGTTLHRAGNDRIFAGVAGGLGEHFGVNAWWFRWAFIFLALFAGVGILVYVVAWLVIPGPDEDEPIAAEWVDGIDWTNGGTVFGVALLGVAGVLVVTQFFHVSGILLLAAVMFIVGLLLYRGDLRPPQRPRTPAPPPSAGTTVEVDIEVTEDTAEGLQTMQTEGDPYPVEDAGVAVAVVAEDGFGGSGTDTVDPQPPVPPRKQRPPQPPRPPRERSVLGRLTIAVGLIVVASMALLDVSDLAIDIEPFHYFAAAIAVLGVGLLIGAWAGRARWLIFIGIIITPLLWLSMLLPVTWDFSIGEFQHTPVTVEEATNTYEQGAGQMTIDLTQLSSGELAEIGTIEASLGLGEMVIRVPSDIGVALSAQVGAGEVSGPFNTVSGVGFDVAQDFGPEPTVLVLDLEVGAGTIHITGPGTFGFGDVFIIEGNNS